MKKIPCLFERDFVSDGDYFTTSSFTLLETVTPGCEWALAGEGVATRKWDGTAVMVHDVQLYKRYDAKRDVRTGEYRVPPDGAIPCADPDPVTGHWPHWVKCSHGSPADKWHMDARTKHMALYGAMADGTYELIGPSFNGNPEGVETNQFRRHGDVVINLPVRSFAGIREFLENNAVEGIVFHHPDGRMCKIRRADFGIPWRTT